MLESRGSKEVRLDMRGLQRIDLAAYQEMPLRLWRLRAPHFRMRHTSEFQSHRLSSCRTVPDGREGTHEAARRVHTHARLAAPRSVGAAAREIAASMESRA